MNTIAFFGVFRKRNYDANAPPDRQLPRSTLLISGGFIMYDDIFESIRYEAEKRNLRESTINLYCANVNYFLRCIGKTASELTLDDAESFLSAKRLEGRSPETHNHYRSAIKFFYKKVLWILWDDDIVPAMKREQNLPAVLSRNEINAIIEATQNLKHKAIIATMYSSGLRVSEAVHLHYDDISRTNMTIHVRETKGRVDRYTILSRKNLDLLTEYWYKCDRPRGILFPSSWTGGYLDITSVNQFTVPENLNPVIYSNQKLLYTALYHAASDTLRELAADPKYLGADIGYICILHTWGSAMNFHPHIHAIVLGGGLDAGNHWKDSGEDFFLPVRVVSRLFRGKYLAELKQLWKDGKLEFHGTAEPYRNHYALQELLDT